MSCRSMPILFSWFSFRDFRVFRGEKCGLAILRFRKFNRPTFLLRPRRVVDRATANHCTIGAASGIDQRHRKSGCGILALSILNAINANPEQPLPVSFAGRDLITRDFRAEILWPAPGRA